MKLDGLSQTVVEMKTLGRHVFYTTPMAHCHLIEPEESVESVATKIRAVIGSPLDEEGAKWYRSIFTVENFKNIVGDLCKQEGWNFV
jgi:hypothetical protein